MAKKVNRATEKLLPGPFVVPQAQTDEDPKPTPVPVNPPPDQQ